MIKIFLCLTVLRVGSCTQPYFPPQIVFSPNDGVTTIVVDEINQRAYQTITLSSYARETSYVMKHFPNSTSDSPQSKNYVQLLVDFPPFNCIYGTYWKYGGNTFNSFPTHWVNGTSCEVKNYIQFNYGMIHSNDSSSDEDYWYANVTCNVDSGQVYPCEEIYFKKNTDIPIRSTRVARGGWSVNQFTTYYTKTSVGKPDEKLFDSIPEGWPDACLDVMLGLFYYPQTSKLMLNQSEKVQVWLISPPHRINGNDTVIIQWKPSQCNDCFTWTPKQLSFNSKSFQDKQTITITRVKDGPKTALIPIFNGGGFNLVSAESYPIYTQ